MAVTVDHQKHPDQTILSNGFFPELSLDRFQKSQRVDKAAPLEQVTDVLESAVARVQRAANTWVCDQICLGYHSLEQVPADTIGDKSTLIRAYEQAVFLRAKGEIIKHFSDYDLTDKGETDNEKRDKRARYQFNQSSRELRIMIGKPATRVSNL